MQKLFSNACRSALCLFLLAAPVLANDSAIIEANGYRSARPQNYKGHVAYVPAGMTLTVYLDNSISTAVAQPGEPVQATLRNPVDLGGASVPAGSRLLGQITDAEAGRRLARSGELGIKFFTLKTPDGREYPITSHLVGKVDKYSSGTGANQDVMKGEGMGNKLGSVAFRGAIGAGSGALLGTAVGAIAGGGRGAGRGAWSGTAIGVGLGAADSLLLRKGNDVQIKSGTALQLQIDAPVTIACY